MPAKLLSLLGASLFLLPLALGGQTTDSKQVEADMQKLKAAGLKSDGPALLAFLRSRTLSEEERERVDLLIAKLGASSFKVREQASEELIAKGPSVLAALRLGLTASDLEVQRRCELCIQKIKERGSPEVTGAVVRLLGVRKPAGAVEALIAYLPWVDDDAAADDIRDVLVGLAARDGKANKTLVQALADKMPVRRAAAAEALVRAGVFTQHKQAVRALLKDSNATVRWRVATALVLAKDKDAVATLIDVMTDVAPQYAWDIEETLCRLAAGKSPPAVALGDSDAARQKCQAAWQKWWQDHAAGVDLAALQAQSELGWTTMVLLDAGRIVELDSRNNVRWQIDELMFPLDLQVLDKGRVLVAEYGGGRVTERNFKGQILWQVEFREPQMAQRVANGNTFVCSKFEMAEFDRNGKLVFSKSFNPLHNLGIMKCMKLPSGEISCFFDDGQGQGQGQVARLDAEGNKVGGFSIEIGTALYGGRIHALANGNVLIPLRYLGKVAEYDSNGKEVWSVKVDNPVAATRLANGNTLVTTMFDVMTRVGQNRAVEFDPKGVQVWQYQYQQDSRLTRALRR